MYLLNFPMNLPNPKAPPVVYKPVKGGPISYQLSNTALFVATDAGQDPISKECVNLFGVHVPTGDIIHGHAINACLVDYTTKRNLS